jgi:Uma2 family endonuclease
LVDRQIEVYRDPLEGKNQTLKSFDLGDELSPLAAPAASVRVADLLP